MFTNYYNILGIPYSATLEEIKKAYKTKAKILHPDVNESANSSKEFTLLLEAYNTLSDVNKKFAFDNKYYYLLSGKRPSVSNHKKANHPKKPIIATSDIKSFQQRKTSTWLYHGLFLFGMLAGFILSFVTLLGTYLKLWPPVFILIIIPGIVLIIEGFNGIIGKKSNIANYVKLILSKFKS